ncbi:MAG: hypothetical protein Q8L74_03095 [Nitrospirota bacterium]|nr:hypothetical protein [Nitrospirota bacterium]MDP2384261.1 hypothetical protein [Nitrospirota bacterium]MDP3598365.1 hypothetical protein [Nitrospirota bacterium]
MRIVCSWCRQEGVTSLVGEKAPLDDARETHGICVFHRHDVQARWQASVRTASYYGVATGLSSVLFRWTGLLNVAKRLRP